MHVVHEAQYDSADTANGPKCHENTRLSIRKEILTWANSTTGPNIFWLSGLAGTGKSTIARTVAKTLADENKLAAGYFFKRGDQGRNGMSRVLTTLMNQIVDHVHGMKMCVLESLGSLDKDALEKKSFEAQFELLFVAPLRKLRIRMPSPEAQTIIIDALDESTEQQYARDLLAQLAKLGDTRPRFNILVTSRATPQLEPQFEMLAECRINYNMLRLQDEFGDETKEDMEKYIRTEFRQIRRRRRIKKDPWPGEDDIQTIISRATQPSPLFIYAASLFRFIAGSPYSEPVEKLRNWLQVQSTDSDQMRAIYHPIIEEAFSNFESNQLANAKSILQSVIIAVTPLSAQDLSDLLGIDIDQVCYILRQFHAVIVDSEDALTPIMLHHKSFSDFLLAEPDKKDHAAAYHIDSMAAHEMLAYECINRMDNGLCRNMRNAPNFTLSTEDISELGLVEIAGGLQYACKQWTQHAVQANLIHSNTARVEFFLKNHFLHWLECLVWSDAFAKAVSCVIALQRVASVSLLCIK